MVNRRNLIQEKKTISKICLFSENHLQCYKEQSKPVKKSSSRLSCRTNLNKISSQQNKQLKKLDTIPEKKIRPKTAQCKTKPVLTAYEKSYEKQLPKNCEMKKQNEEESVEINYFFEAVKATVQSVLREKFDEYEKNFVCELKKKIFGIENKLHNTEKNLSILCKQINDKISQYGEEHNQHFRLICLKLEYDKVFYQYLNEKLQSDYKSGNDGSLAGGSTFRGSINSKSNILSPTNKESNIQINIKSGEVIMHSSKPLENSSESSPVLLTSRPNLEKFEFKELYNVANSLQGACDRAEKRETQNSLCSSYVNLQSCGQGTNVSGLLKQEVF